MLLSMIDKIWDKNKKKALKIGIILNICVYRMDMFPMIITY